MLNNPMQLIQMLQNAQNPMGLLKQMAQTNPQIQQAINIVESKSPEELREYVKNVCITQNIDINSLAKQFNLPLW